VAVHMPVPKLQQCSASFVAVESPQIGDPPVGSDDVDVVRARGHRPRQALDKRGLFPVCGGQQPGQLALPTPARGAAIVIACSST
jgi:hypothetical protein